MSRISFSDNEESKGRVVKVQVVDRDTIEVAIKLFPELKVLRELYHRIRAIEARRMELLLEVSRQPCPFDQCMLTESGDSH